MAMQNTTFKLSEDDLGLLDGLATEMKCSRTDVVRRGLRELETQRQRRYEIAQRFIEQMHGRVPKGKNLMIGLDDKNQPYATIDGRERLDGFVLTGRTIGSPKDQAIIVGIRDPDHDDLEVVLGAIHASGPGGWLLVPRDVPVHLAWRRS
jgi:predicted transcriptional regulator